MKKKGVMKISDYLNAEIICFLEEQTRDEAIDALISLLENQGRLPDKGLFRDAIFHREELVSTGIGMGIAIPHAKMKSIHRFFIAIGIQKEKGIEWNSLDKAPVRIVFMIGGPEDKQTEYLQILSMLTAAIKDVDLRKKLLKSTSTQEVFELFSNFL